MDPGVEDLRAAVTAAGLGEVLLVNVSPCVGYVLHDLAAELRVGAV